MLALGCSPHSAAAVEPLGSLPSRDALVAAWPASRRAVRAGPLHPAARPTGRVGVASAAPNALQHAAARVGTAAALIWRGGGRWCANSGQLLWPLPSHSHARPPFREGGGCGASLRSHSKAALACSSNLGVHGPANARTPRFQPQEEPQQEEWWSVAPLADRLNAEVIVAEQERLASVARQLPPPSRPLPRDAPAYVQSIAPPSLARRPFWPFAGSSPRTADPAAGSSQSLHSHRSRSRRAGPPEEPYVSCAYVGAGTARAPLAGGWLPQSPLRLRPRGRLRRRGSDGGGVRGLQMPVAYRYARG